MRLAGSWLESLGHSIPAAPNPLTRRSGTTRLRWAAPMEVTAGRRRRSLLLPVFLLAIPTGVLVGAVAGCALMRFSILQAACNPESFAGRGPWGYGIVPVVYGMPVGGVVALVPGLGTPTGPQSSSLPPLATEKEWLSYPVRQWFPWHSCQPFRLPDGSFATELQNVRTLRGERLRLKPYGSRCSWLVGPIPWFLLEMPIPRNSRRVTLRRRAPPPTNSQPPRLGPRRRCPPDARETGHRGSRCFRDPVPAPGFRGCATTGGVFAP
jgi:hypothetical protein